MSAVMGFIAGQEQNDLSEWQLRCTHRKHSVCAESHERYRNWNGVRAYVVWCFFFFQAEDGIRDLTVTGVQTCALPISMIRVSYADLDLNSEQGRRAMRHRLASAVDMVCSQANDMPDRLKARIAYTNCRDRKSVV